MTERRLFNIRAAVEHLRALGADAVTVNFVRNLVNRGEVPHLRIGKKFYLRCEDLDAWIGARAKRRRP